ncbi:hypothetical protein [Mycobacterium lepromatosis]|uniref:hypothetical protein n=1 Tax=Mycobacterium lepromatosis TaxID=480418 RepID=UPI003B50A4F0
MGLSRPFHLRPGGLAGTAGLQRCLDRRTVTNPRTGHVLGEVILRSARQHEDVDQRRVGSIFDIDDVVLVPTTAQPP